MKPLFETEATVKAPAVGTIFQEITPQPANLPAVAPTRAVAPVRVVTDVEIDRLGAKVSGRTSQTATKIMAAVKASDVDGFGEKLNELVAVSKQLDPKKMAQRGILGKLSNLWGGTKEKFMAQYQTVEQRMNALISEMDKTAGNQTQRIADLEQMFADNEASFYAFGAEIEACEQLRDALQAQLAAESEAKDTFAAQRQADINDRIHRVEKKIDDFKRSQALCQLAAPEIRMMQSNARQLATTFNDIKVTTVPAWQGVFSRYILSMEQKKAAELATTVHDATNEAFRQQADLLRQNVQQIAKAKERSVVDIETLEHMQQQLLGAVDDAKRIAEEGKRGRAEARVKLASMEQQLIQSAAATPQLTSN